MPRESMQAWDDARKAREADPENPELIDAEYAAEREHFRRIEKAERWRRLIVYALVVGAFAILTAFGASQQAKLNDTVDDVAHLSIENRALTTSLQSALVEACEHNTRLTNQRTRVDREELHEEIYEAEHPNKEAFDALVESGIPPEAIEKSEERAVAILKDRLARVKYKTSSCENQYHISPGSGNRRRDQNG